MEEDLPRTGRLTASLALLGAREAPGALIKMFLSRPRGVQCPVNRYSRQILFTPLGPSGQERLRVARALVVGCGALGTHSAELLARAGIGSLRLVDRDVVEWSNLHRQGGFEESHAREGMPKAQALAGWLRRINSEVEVDARVTDFNFTNALELADGATVIIDGTDNLPTRFLLNDVSYRLAIPWVYAGAVGSSAHVQLFSGSRGPCLRCQLPTLPPPGTIATCDTSGVIGPTAALAAAWQAASALRAVSADGIAALAGKKAMLDPWAASARVVDTEADPECPACAKGRFEALEGAHGERATLLCGRAAVQVLPAGPSTGGFNWEEAMSRIAHLGPIEMLGRVLRVHSKDGFTLTLFDDGRAIFDGLTDPVQARTLYARFIGQ